MPVRKGASRASACSPRLRNPHNNATRKFLTPLDHKSLTCAALRDKLLAGQAFSYLTHERAFVAAPPRALFFFWAPCRRPTAPGAFGVESWYALAGTPHPKRVVARPVIDHAPGRERFV